MHKDRQMQRYGIAAHAIRDSENKKIRAGRPIHGAYPWIDRAGKNLFFTQVGGLGLFYRNDRGKVKTRFPILNPPRNREVVLDNPTRFGVSYFGLWSQGKIVIPDTRVNNIDYHLGKKSYRPVVQLYEDDPAGVELDRATIVGINSPENQWNFLQSLHARSPRDVIWWLSASNGMTDEVVFDDSLDTGTLIYSPMNAAIDNKNRNWRDGFDYKKMQGYVKTPRVQNAAASQLQWKLPKFGKLLGGRIEPIAAGGIQAKGLWLNGEQTRLSYAIPEQAGSAANALLNATWTTTLWVDPRTDRPGRLMTFPDGSWIDIEMGGLVFGNTSGSTVVPTIPPNLRLVDRQWSHLALVSTPSWTDFYLQGFKLTTIQGSFFRIQPGLLSLGDPPTGEVSGTQAWVDELRVVSGDRDPEQLCNYAHGTLRGLDPTNNSSDFAFAGNYPEASHGEISALIAATGRPSFDRYLCERTRDQAHPCLTSIHQSLSNEPSCVRAGLLFPEGPLFHDRPRPDSRGNPFCLSCHSEDQSNLSLRVAPALRSGPMGTDLFEDNRRQPSQAPRRLHGFVPKELLNLPDDLKAPTEGLLLDPLLYPSVQNVGLTNPVVLGDR
jgi:hypothetical protein